MKWCQNMQVDSKSIHSLSMKENLTTLLQIFTKKHLKCRIRHRKSEKRRDQSQDLIYTEKQWKPKAKRHSCQRENHWKVAQWRTIVWSTKIKQWKGLNIKSIIVSMDPLVILKVMDMEEAWITWIKSTTKLCITHQ